MADEETPTPRRKRPARKPAAKPVAATPPTPPEAPTPATPPTPPEAPTPLSESIPEAVTPDASVTNDLLRQLLDARQQDRAELAALRKEFAQSRTAAPAMRTARPMTDEELMMERLREIEENPFYCPGCGALYKRERDCTGRGEAPHPAIEVVSTDELKGNDPSRHTEAPGVNP